MKQFSVAYKIDGAWSYKDFTYRYQAECFHKQAKVAVHIEAAVLQENCIGKTICTR